MDGMTPSNSLAGMPMSSKERKRLYNAKYRIGKKEYFRDKERKRRLEKSDEINAKARKYRRENPDKVRSFNLKKTYGITLSEFEVLFDSQHRKCAICKCSEPSGKNWHVDHCHKLGTIRGILCHPCNLMIGHAKDNIDTLLAGVEYLK